VDVVDLAVLRHMFPQGEARLWGSRLIVDPRISPREIGARVGLSEVAVRNRIAKMTAEGFIQGHIVWPNPQLFGASLRVMELPSRDLTDTDRILLALDRVDGVISARVMIDEDGRHVRVSFIDDAQVKTEERVRRIAAVADSNACITSLPEWLPSCPPRLPRLDWRVIFAIRSAPELPLNEHARRLGLSTKTVRRRFNELLDSQSMFWSLDANNSLLSVAACFIWLHGPTLRETVCQEIEHRIGSWIPAARGGIGEPPNPSAPWIFALFWLRSPAESDGLARVLLTIPGVTAVQRRFPSDGRSYPSWLDRKIGKELLLGEGTAFNAARRTMASEWLAAR